MDDDASASAAPEEPVAMVFHDVHDHGVEICRMWKKEVEERCGGRVHVDLYVGGALKNPGSADVFRDVPAGGGRYLLLDLVQMPFTMPGSVIGSRVIARLFSEFKEMRDELSDFKVVGLGTGSVMGIFSSREWGPVRSVKDLEGARIRSLLPIDAAIQNLGAQPLHVPYPEIPAKLASGEIDAAVLGLLPAMMFRLAEGPAPHCTIAADRSLTLHPMRVGIKWDSWARLPAFVRQVIDGLGPAGENSWFATHCGPDFDSHLDEALAYIGQTGKLVVLDTGEFKKWRELMQPAVDSRVRAAEANGLPGKRFYARMLELVEEYSCFIPPGG